MTSLSAYEWISARGSVGWRGTDTSMAGICLLQDLRRLLVPPELRATG